MKRSSKASLAAAGIVSAVSGALALYLAKHPKLRKEIGSSDSPADALKTFGDHVQKDSSKFMEHLGSFLRRQRSGADKAVKRTSRRVARSARKARESIEEAAERGAENVERMTDRI